MEWPTYIQIQQLLYRGSLLIQSAKAKKWWLQYKPYSLPQSSIALNHYFYSENTRNSTLCSPTLLIIWEISISNHNTSSIQNWSPKRIHMLIKLTVNIEFKKRKPTGKEELQRVLKLLFMERIWKNAKSKERAHKKNGPTKGASGLFFIFKKRRILNP